MKLFDELAERVEELQRGLDAANWRTSKQHYALEKRHYALAERAEKLERLVGWYAGYPRRVDREAGATASRPAWERDLGQHIDITGEPKDSTEIGETSKGQPYIKSIKRYHVDDWQHALLEVFAMYDEARKQINERGG